MKDGELFGPVNTYTTHEQVFAWMRLMMGAYPGTFIELKGAA